MALTKAAVAFLASTSVIAGTPQTGSWIDLTGSYDTNVVAKITNGGTGPTIGCTVSIDLSPDNGTTVYVGAGGSFTAGLTASAVYTGEFALGSAMYARVVFSGNTAQNVAGQADGMKVTAI